MNLISLSVHSILEEVEGRLHSIDIFADNNHFLKVAETGSILSSSLGLLLHLTDLIFLEIILHQI